MGLLLGVAQRQRRTAAPDRDALRAARRAGTAAGARPGRQGHHVRHRRHLDQAGRRHGADEGRHGRRRRRRSCAMRAIALLKPPIRVIGVVPTAENMPGGTRDQAGRRPHERERQDRRGHQHRRRRPADSRRRPLVRARAGRDAPRRRRDADRRLSSSRSARPPSGLFGTPDWWRRHVRRVADRAGDRVWPMPLFDEYREQLKSDIADMINIGGRAAGAITAAMFLKEFTGGLPWAHLDIAGTAWADEAKPFSAQGRRAASRSARWRSSRSPATAGCRRCRNRRRITRELGAGLQRADVL